MRRILIITLASIVLFQCNQNNITISDDKVGNIKLGFTIAKVKKKLKDCEFKEINTDDRNMYYDYYDVYEDGKKILCLRFDDYLLTGIQVLTNKYMTSKGIAVGSTSQKVADYGYRLSFGMMNDEGIPAKSYEDDLNFVFSKRVTESGRISKHAVIKKIIIGDNFTLQKESKEESIDFKTENNLFTSNFFNIQVQIPENWTVKTQESNIEKVKEMLFIVNEKTRSNLLIIAEKLQNKNLKTGLDYFNHVSGMLSLTEVSDKAFIIAGKEFYSAKNQISINSEIQDQIHYATVENGYTILITGKYYDSINLTEIEDIIFSTEMIK